MNRLIENNSMVDSSAVANNSNDGEENKLKRDDNLN